MISKQERVLAYLVVGHTETPRDVSNDITKNENSVGILGNADVRGCVTEGAPNSGTEQRQRNEKNSVD